MVFRFDSKIFADAEGFDPHVLSGRFRELAYLNRTATIRYRFRDQQEKNEKWKVLHYEGGLKAYVQWLTRGKTPMHDVFHVTGTIDDIEV